jgi:hypothetical protein
MEEQVRTRVAKDDAVDMRRVVAFTSTRDVGVGVQKPR